MSERPHADSARRFGWWSLWAWALLGVAMEAAHAFKLAAFLDGPHTRELLRWGHAHGVGLSLVVLAYAAVGARPDNAGAGKLLQAAAIVLPAGFALGAVGASEVDPGPAIWLVPVGALLLLVGLWRVARSQA